VVVGIAEGASRRKGCRVDSVRACGGRLDEPQASCVSSVSRLEPVADDRVRFDKGVAKQVAIADAHDLGSGKALDEARCDIVSRAADEDDTQAHVPEPTTLSRVEALLAFGASLLALRLSGALAGRWRVRRAPELAAWSASLAAYAVASAALAWGAAAGWSDEAFRLYYLFGGLLTAPLLGLGSLLLLRGGTVPREGLSPISRVIVPVVLLYCGLAAGVAIAEPLNARVGGSSIPEAQEHLDFIPARLLAVAGNSAGTLAVVAVAVATLRRRLLGNALIVAGVGVAAAGSALAGLGEAETAAFIAAAAVLFYGGFVAPGSGGRR
jgi:hypothetical protein